MSSIIFGQSWAGATQTQPSGNGATSKHFMWPEDFTDSTCPMCGSWAKGDWQKYRSLVQAYHGIDLADSKEGKSEFMVWFSSSPVETEHSLEETVEKLSRLNTAKRLFASMRQKT